VTPLPGRGHFIQEEVPEQVGELLAEFFSATRQQDAGDGALAPPSRSA
jgi:hypothetical protein